MLLVSHGIAHPTPQRTCIFILFCASTARWSSGAGDALSATWVPGWFCGAKRICVDTNQGGTYWLSKRRAHTMPKYERTSNTRTHMRRARVCVPNVSFTCYTCAFLISLIETHARVTYLHATFECKWMSTLQKSKRSIPEPSERERESCFVVSVEFCSGTYGKAPFT